MRQALPGHSLSSVSQGPWSTKQARTPLALVSFRASWVSLTEAVGPWPITKRKLLGLPCKVAETTEPRHSRTARRHGGGERRGHQSRPRGPQSHGIRAHLSLPNLPSQYPTPAALSPEPSGSRPHFFHSRASIWNFQRSSPRNRQAWCCRGSVRPAQLRAVLIWKQTCRPQERRECLEW